MSLSPDIIKNSARTGPSTTCVPGVNSGSGARLPLTTAFSVAEAASPFIVNLQNLHSQAAVEVLRPLISKNAAETVPHRGALA